MTEAEFVIAVLSLLFVVATLAFFVGVVTGKGKDR